MVVSFLKILLLNMNHTYIMYFIYSENSNELVMIPLLLKSEIAKENEKCRKYT